MTQETDIETGVVPAGSEGLKTRKILVLTVHVADYELLKGMLARGQEWVPSLDMDGVVSAVVAEACRVSRARNLTTDGH